MSENNTETSFNEPKIHLIVRGEWGKNILSGVSLPQTNSLIIEYLENDTPLQNRLSKVDIVIEIADQFNHAMIAQTQYQAEMAFLIGGITPNSKGVIQSKGNCYVVHSNSIEDYRLLISIIINMLYSPGLINVDLADLKDVFNKGAYGFIASSQIKGKEVPNRSEIAAKETIAYLKSQLPDFKQAKSCLICITSGMDLGFHEFIQISEIFGEAMGEDTIIVTGCSLDFDLEPEERVIVSAIVMI